MNIDDLTWKDIQDIYIMVDNLTNKLDCDPSLWPEWAFSTEGRFTYILNQFKKTYCGKSLGKEEPASEDLEEAASKYVREDFHERSRADFKADAEWQRKKDQETIELAEDHAMLAGMEKMREEMMKGAVLETRVYLDSDGDGIETPYNEWLSLENNEITYLPEHLGLKDGDRVKVVIIKEDKQ